MQLIREIDRDTADALFFHTGRQTQAQVQQPGFFGYLDGMYALPTSTHSSATNVPSGPGFGVRPSIGARYQYWKSTFDDGAGLGVNATDKSWGIGPRIGIDASLNLFGPVSLFGGVETSFLFGKSKTSVSDGIISINSDRSRTIWEVGAKVGLAWEVAPLVNVAAGYRFDCFDGVQPSGRSTPPLFHRAAVPAS